MDKNQKIKNLTVYASKLNGQLTTIPARHQNRKEAYLAFISREIKRTQDTLEKLIQG